MLKEFKKFILRGNVVDLAVAVVIGAAFGAIVTALVKDLITPLIGALYGDPKQAHGFQTASFSLRGSQFMYGDFINAIVTFVIIAAVIFFLVVTPLNRLQARTNRNKTPAEPTEKKCPECLSTIPKEAKRCAFCTSKVS